MNVDSELAILEHWVDRIGEDLDVPIWKRDTFVYAKVTAKHVAFLKAVRVIHSLHSLPLLYQRGLFIDAGTIVRCIMDCLNEIYFLLEDYPKTSASVDKFVRYFEATSLIRDDEKPNAIPSKKIHNAKARILQNYADFNGCRNSIRRIYETFCGYVHSNYPHIMEIYGGPPNDLRFHMAGVPSSREKGKYAVLIEEIIKDAQLTLAFMALKLNLADLFSEIKSHIS
jgi:hypothetical protein